MLLHKSVEHDSRVRREASALAAAGRPVTVLELAPAEGELDGFRRRSVLPPAWVRRVMPFHLYRIAFLAAFVVGIVRERPAVVHAHDAAMLLPGLIGARLTGARLVYDSHELATGVPYRDGAWERFVHGIERIGVPRASLVITVTDGIAERLRERYRLRRLPTVVRNVSDLERPSNGAPAGGLRERLGLGDVPVVLHQGAPAGGRGCEALVRAVADVPGAHLVFLGSGEPGYAESLVALAQRTGVGDRVHVHESVPLEDLLRHTREADVGVSLLEDTCENHRLALPNKLFEYLAAGVPVVTSDLPELRRVVRGYDVGWTVDPSSTEDIARGLREALERGGARDLLERVRAADEDLRWESERERLLGAYDRLLAPQR